MSSSTSTTPISAWLESLRPRTLPLAFASIVVGSAIAAWHGSLKPEVALLALVTAGLLQILSNLANDYGDAVKGSDKEDRIGPLRGMQKGMITQAQMKRALVVTVVLIALAGCSLIAVACEQPSDVVGFLVLGGLSIVAAITYTVGNKPYGYLGLGDISVLVFFGWLSVAGTYYLQTHTFDSVVMLPATACGLLATAVLNINNLRDIESDRENGKNTLAVRLGPHKARIYHALLLGGAVLCFALFTLFNLHSLWGWLFVLAIPLLVRHGLRVLRDPTPVGMRPMLEHMVKAALLANLLFAIGVDGLTRVIDRFLSLPRCAADLVASLARIFPRSLLDAEPISSVIEGMTDQRMLERHGDLVDDRAIAEAANEAVQRPDLSLIVRTSHDDLAVFLRDRDALGDRTLQLALGPVDRHEVSNHADGDPREGAGGGDGRAQALGAGDSTVGVAGRHDDCELLAAVAGRHIAGSERGRQRPADLAQHLVANLVSVRVVDVLEVVDVEQGEGHRLAGAERALDLPEERVVEGATVRQCGEAVDHGEPPHLLQQAGLAVGQRGVCGELSEQRHHAGVDARAPPTAVLDREHAERPMVGDERHDDDVACVGEHLK